MSTTKRPEKNYLVINNLQNRQKALNLLGLAMRAGKLVTGSTAVIESLRRKKVKVIILASDLHPNTLEKVKRAGKADQAIIINAFSAAELAKAIGKKRKVLGLADRGFSKALIKKIDEGV